MWAATLDLGERELGADLRGCRRPVSSGKWQKGVTGEVLDGEALRPRGPERLARAAGLVLVWPSRSWQCEHVRPEEGRGGLGRP